MATSALRIGDYELEGLLGEGGVTETYRARRADPAPGEEGKRFAFKLLREDRGGHDASVVERFRGVAERGQELDEPELVRVVDVAPRGSVPAHYVAELIDGVDCACLVEAMAGTPLDPSAIASIGAQVARALAVLHDRDPPVAHGGLAPGNVLVDRGGVVTIADVGVAAALRPVTEYAVERYAYVAPELFDPGAEPTPASDLYSLGAVLCFLLTGAPPVSGETLTELRDKLAAGPPDLAGAPEPLAKTVRLLLAPTPQGRPRSAAAVALALTPSPKARATSTTLAFDSAAATAALSAAVARALTPEEAAASSSDGLAPMTIAPLQPQGASDSDVIGFAAAPRSGPHDSMFGVMSVVAPVSLDVAPQPDAPEPAPAVGSGALLAHLELPQTPERASGPGVAIPRFTAGIPLVDPAVNPSAAMLDVGVVDLGAPAVDPASGGGGTRTTQTRTVAPPTLGRRHGSARAGAVAKPLARTTTKPNKIKTPAEGTKPKRGGALLGLGGVLAVALVALKLLFSSRAPTVAQPRAVAQPAAVEAPAPVPKPKSPADVGRLSVITTPPGATVWIDGEEKGRTPLEVKTKPGGHRVVIVKLGFKMLREVVDTTDSMLLKRTLAAANANFGGQVPLKVSCKTEGKYPVFVDGRDTGLLCPVDGLMIAPGQRLVGVFVIPQNKVWNFEREVLQGAKSHKVSFNY